MGVMGLMVRLQSWNARTIATPMLIVSSTLGGATMVAVHGHIVRGRQTLMKVLRQACGSAIGSTRSSCRNRVQIGSCWNEVYWHLASCFSFFRDINWDV